jgi:hypothetical protein
MSTTATTATNGYMIRLELLKMAKEMLEQDWHAQREGKVQEWQASREVYPGDFAPKDPKPFPIFKLFPTEEEIIKKAKVLNEFINTK